MTKKHPKKSKIDRILDYKVAQIRKKRAQKKEKDQSYLYNIDKVALLKESKQLFNEIEALVRGGASGFVKNKTAELISKRRELEKELERKQKKREKIEKQQNADLIKMIRAGFAKADDRNPNYKTLESYSKDISKRLRVIRLLEPELEKLRNVSAKLKNALGDSASKEPTTTTTRAISSPSRNPDLIQSLIQAINFANKFSPNKVEIPSRPNIDDEQTATNQHVDDLFATLDGQIVNANDSITSELIVATATISALNNPTIEDQKNIENAIELVDDLAIDKEATAAQVEKKLNAEKEQRDKYAQLIRQEPGYWEKPKPADIKALLGELRKYAHGKFKRSGATLRVLDKGLGFYIKKFVEDSTLLTGWVKEDKGSHKFVEDIFDILVNKGYFVRKPNNHDLVIWDMEVDDYIKLLKDYGLDPWVWNHSELTNQPEAAAEPEPEAAAEKSPEEQALESLSGIKDPSLRKFAFINNFLIGPNGQSLQNELANSMGRYENRYGNSFREQLQAIMKYLISLQQQAEKMLGKAPHGLSSSNLGTNPRLKQLAPELTEKDLDAANKVYRDLSLKNLVSYRDLVATVVDLHMKKGALRGKTIKAFFDDNISKYAENPMLLVPPEPKRKQKPQANENKKTISDITDQLMEQLYDTLN